MNAIILSLISGINIAFALLSFFIFYKNSAQKFYLYFSLFSLFSGFYFLLSAISVDANIDIRWLVLFCAAVYYAIFPWFIFEYIGKRPNLFLWLLSSVFVAAISVFILNPDPGNFAIWQILAHIGLVGLMVVAMYAAFITRKNNAFRAREFAFLSLLFVILGMEEIISNYTGLQFLSRYFIGILPLDIYPLLFTIVFSIRLSNEIIAKNKYKIKIITGEIEKHKLAVKELENQKLQDSLNYKDQDLTNFGIEISRQSEFTELIYEKLIGIKQNGNIDLKEFNKIVALTKSHLQIDKQLEVLQKNIKRVNTEFSSRLNATYPQLTANEVQLASLLRLKLNTKEIAVIKNISPDSAKVLRYRLRKKLNIPTQTSLTQFFQEIN